MKKLLLLFLTITAVTFSSYAQCVPDPQFTQSGIYPDSATGMATAYVGATYSEVLTVIVPVDTVVDVPPFGPMTVSIIDITLDNITGLPANFTYTCSPANCVFPGGTSGCVNVYSSVDPTIPDVGVYPLLVNVTATATGGITQPATIDYYFIEIVDTTSVGIGQFNDESFELKTIYPNPVENNSKIQFISGVNTEVTFRVTNLLGKTIVNREISAKRGVNDIYISATDFANGIYLYSITSNGKTSTKRMIINK